MADKYLDQALDSVTSDLSKKLDPFHKGGAIDNNTTTPYCGIKKVPAGKHRGNQKECFDKNQIRYYGIENIDNKFLKNLQTAKPGNKKREKLINELSKETNFKNREELIKKIKMMKVPKKGEGYGGGLDIHKAILKVAPKKGFVMPGHRYTGPGNPLEQQLRYDPNTGQILEIYQQPTGRTDAVSMQHDVDYSVCGNKPKGDQVKCKNNADRKMVKALDAIPWNDRQWGHTIARNAIAAKSKLGMGVKKPKNGKSRRVRKTGKKN